MKFSCLYLLPLTCFLVSTPEVKSKPPNIVLILADDLGYGDLGCFGQKVLKTPRLDAMARDGMKLTQFYAGSTVCAPSRSVLLTGKHMGRTVVRGNSSLPIIIKPGQPTIASVLKKAGYKTACIGKWGVGTPDNFTNPNDVGFDHFYGYVNMWHAHNFYPEFLIRNGKVFPLKNVVAEKWRRWQDPKLPQAGRGVAVKKVEYAPDLFIEDALRFIRENHKKPFFLYFAMNVPHANNEAGNKGMEVPELGKFTSRDWPEPEKGFAAMIQNIDRDTGRVLDLLAELKIDKDTLVLFTSDNGPHQEGGHKADFFDSNGKYRGIKRDLYEGGIRVPTIAWWPETIKAGTTDNHQWYFGDVMASAAELAGTPAPEDINSDSFVPTLRGKPPEKEWSRKSHLYWEFYERGSAQAVRFGKWKAIRSPMFTGPIELYDLSWDHDENQNYAARRPKLVEHAANLLNKLHEADPNWKTPQQRAKKAR
jgi:arylsulfatase A-like enzyme